LIDFVAGQLSSVITCSICGNKSTCWDPFWDLSLPLPRGRYVALSNIDVYQGCNDESTFFANLFSFSTHLSTLHYISRGEVNIERCIREFEALEELDYDEKPVRK